MRAEPKHPPAPVPIRETGGEEERHPAECWSCHGPVEPGRPFCPVCDAVQPPGQVDHFTRLGLQAAFDIDKKKLDSLYFSLQRLLHPDGFATKSPREKALSQQQATSLNEAYEALKDDLGRADYLIHLKGTKVLPEGCNLVNDALLLAETLELREALSEAETRDDVEVLARRADKDIRVCIEELAKLFAADDLEGACRQTTRLKYLRKLAAETRAARARFAG
jgi:molecular chaperone HscB